MDEKTQETVGKRYDWLDARNVCRKYCMDSISIESEQEWNMVKNNVSSRELPHVGDSGWVLELGTASSRLKTLLGLNCLVILSVSICDCGICVNQKL